MKKSRLDKKPSRLEDDAKWDEDDFEIDKTILIEKMGLKAYNEKYAKSIANVKELLS